MSDLAWSVQAFDCLNSTQDYIKSNIDNLNEGSCIQAFSQDDGYGRHGRVWNSPEGNLYLSFLLKPSCRASEYGQVALIAGLAVARTVSPFELCILKWPNDVLINGRKVCGVIVEAANDTLIVGVGLNVNEAPLEDSVSLKGHNLQIENIRDDLLDHFRTLYLEWKQYGFQSIRTDWMRCSFNIDQLMSVKIGNKVVSGKYQGLDKAGYLLLLCDKTNKVITVTSGDVFQSDAACD